MSMDGGAVPEISRSSPSCALVPRLTTGRVRVQLPALLDYLMARLGAVNRTVSPKLSASRVCWFRRKAGGLSASWERLHHLLCATPRGRVALYYLSCSWRRSSRCCSRRGSITVLFPLEPRGPVFGLSEEANSRSHSGRAATIAGRNQAEGMVSGSGSIALR